MTYLILSIFFTTLLIVIFKLFARFNINTFNAITINYYFCFLTAWITIGHFPLNKSMVNASYIPYALALSILFITGFNIVAVTVEKYGIALATIMQKMSLIMPVSFAILYFSENLTYSKGMGLILALVAIILINLPSKKEVNYMSGWALFLFPFFTWLFSGLIEIGLLYLSKTNLVHDGDPAFFAVLFGFAGFIGTLILIYKYIKTKKIPSKRDLYAGIILGIPNFFSMFFLIKALGLNEGGSRILPINNVAIIIFSAFIALFLFKEKLSKINLFGIFFAILSIIIISLS